MTQPEQLQPGSLDDFGTAVPKPCLYFTVDRSPEAQERTRKILAKDPMITVYNVDLRLASLAPIR